MIFLAMPAVNAVAWLVKAHKQPILTAAMAFADTLMMILTYV
ncbi:hypothetical protein [Moraxella caviae]|nr:hypothetical protein [Moraxella caviae]